MTHTQEIGNHHGAKSIIANHLVQVQFHLSVLLLQGTDL